VLLLAAVAYYILELALVALNGRESALARAVGRDVKGRASIVLYLAALPLAYFAPWASLAIYTIVAFMWLVPDRRIERTLAGRE
jgi:uncharacterized membrane protein